MELLPSPFEILELADGQSIELKITKWELGETVIHPRWPGAPPERRINCLRVHVPEKFKRLFPHYWDITSKTLIAQLLPYLEGRDFTKKTFRIRAHGVAPKKRYTLEIF